MNALLKRVVTKIEAVRARSRPTPPNATGPIPLLEQFLSAYWPETRTERTTDAVGAEALIATVPGRPNWILTPTPGLLSFGAGDELAANNHRRWWSETETLPNDAAIGSAAAVYGWSRDRPSTAAIG